MPFLKNCPAPLLDSLAEIGILKDYIAGQCLIEHASVPDKLHFIIRGNIKLQLDAHPNVFWDLIPGEPVGIIQLLDPGPYPWRAMVESNARTIQISIREILLEVDNHSEGGHIFLKQCGQLIARRLRKSLTYL